MNFIFCPNPILSLAVVRARTTTFYSHAAVPRLTGVEGKTLRYYCRLGLIAAHHGVLANEPTFDEDALHEVRRSEHYRRHLGIGTRELPSICRVSRAGGRLKLELRFPHCA